MATYLCCIQQFTHFGAQSSKNLQLEIIVTSINMNPELFPNTRSCCLSYHQKTCTKNCMSMLGPNCYNIIKCCSVNYLPNCICYFVNIQTRVAIITPLKLLLMIRNQQSTTILISENADPTQREL